MSKKIVIIGKDECMFCKNAVLLCTARKLPFEYINVPDDISLTEAFKLAKTTFQTFPYIFVDNGDGTQDGIGGFSELRTKASGLKF